ncbi:ribbon-helix-helix domain-containing protein [Photobacterium phosphoreum]|uniref:ribbon-helix-helix domain-containing protein n=1 Tax=Photobacterium phosphoreum TaxID=659 RepID=UPI001E4049CA|nr:ribbon-helix-helix domain-containing protein [Photobacterium phosphoreum]
MKKKCKSRMSVSFTEEHYSQLCVLSEEKDVSLAWLIRKAVEAYIQVEQNKKVELKGR